MEYVEAPFAVVVVVVYAYAHISAITTVPSATLAPLSVTVPWKRQGGPLTLSGVGGGSGVGVIVGVGVSVGVGVAVGVGVGAGVGVGVGAGVGVGVGVEVGIGFTGYSQAFITSSAVHISRPVSGLGG